MRATQLAGLVGLLHGHLYCLIVVASTYDEDRYCDGDLASFNSNEKSFLPFVDEFKNMPDIAVMKAGPLGDFFQGASPVAKQGDAVKQLQRLMPSPSNVLRQTHHEGILVRYSDDEGRNSGLAKSLESSKSPLATNEEVALGAVVARPRSDRHGLLQSKAADIVDNDVKLSLISFPGIEYLNPVYRDHAKLRDRQALIHAALLKRVRAAIP
ncbi:hypothetical protein D9M72_410720 [compost metagenome]